MRSNKQVLVLSLVSVMVAAAGGFAAERSVRLSDRVENLLVRAKISGNLESFNTAAYTQAGHAVSAIELLEATDASVHLGAGPARDFHLAIAYQQRARAEDDELARLAYDRAIEWMSDEAPGNLHLRRLAAQTAEALGLDPPDR